jgi:hypothetical protein
MSVEVMGWAAFAALALVAAFLAGAVFIDWLQNDYPNFPW